MPWTRLIAAALLAAAAQGAMADVVVIRANGPSAARYPAGKSLPDAARLALQRGDEVVVLDAHGTRRLDGPGMIPVTGGPAAAAPSALAVLTSSGNRRVRVGAVRDMANGTTATMRPGIFLVDVAAPGRMCIVDPAGATLWRGNTQAGGATTLTGADGKVATVTWIKGQSTQPWPAALPITQGARYSVAGATGAPVPIAFETLAAAPADLPQLASALIAHGCRAQVDVLVATTSTAAAPATGG